MRARLEDAAQCLLVIIGATTEDKKKLAGLIHGVRESAQSWKELLLELKRRALAMGTRTCHRRPSTRLLASRRGSMPTRGQHCGARSDLPRDPADSFARVVDTPSDAKPFRAFPPGVATSSD
jgi:hypothetical protein